MTPDEFWTHVDKSSECWEWTAGGNRDGRGRVSFEGRMQYAYRVAWQLAHGEPIPAHLHACHHCDNPACVRPEHIFIGTAADNMADAKQKGRTRAPAPRIGLDHHAASVAPEVVAAAVNEYLSTAASQSDVAAKYGVHQGSISNWLYGRTRPDSGLRPGRAKPKPPLKPCGTHAAFVRHKSHGEEPCEACKAAETAHCSERWKRIKAERAQAAGVASPSPRPLSAGSGWPGGPATT